MLRLMPSTSTRDACLSSSGLPWADSGRPDWKLFRLILRKEYRRAVGTHYGPTRIRLAAFSLCHRRDGRAGTTILQLVSASYNRTKALPSDYWPAGLLKQGQRRRISQSRRTVLLDYGPASSSRRAVGTTGPFRGPRAGFWAKASTRRSTDRARAG